MKVVLGSMSIPKRNAVEAAFRIIRTIDPDLKVFSVDVDPGVSDHPLSQAETLQGARQRASEALKLDLEADLAVGPQSGFHEFESGCWLDQGWVVILSRQSLEGVACTVGVPMPTAVMQRICQGEDPDAALLAARDDSRIQKDDQYSGYLSERKVRRSQLFIPAIAHAMYPFVHPEDFPASE